MCECPRVLRVCLLVCLSEHVCMYLQYMRVFICTCLCVWMNAYVCKPTPLMQHLLPFQAYRSHPTCQDGRSQSAFIFTLEPPPPLNGLCRHCALLILYCSVSIVISDYICDRFSSLKNEIGFQTCCCFSKLFLYPNYVHF